MAAGKGMGILGTKGEDAADRDGRVVIGIDGQLWDGLATERLLNTADTPSPNSNSGESFRGVFQTPPDPGSGVVEG
jgi:hypothetical protein